jgi:hypothetical protein
MNIDELKFSDLLTILRSSFWTLMLTAFLFSGVASIYIFNQPNTYKSNAVLTVYDDKDIGGGITSMLDQYSSLASLAGVNIPSSGPSKSDLVVATINSRDFFSKLYSSKQFMSSLIGSPMEDNALSFEEAYRIYRNKVRVSIEPEGSFLIISSTHNIPINAYNLINSVIEETNLSFRQKHFAETELAMKYLTEQLESTPQNFIRQALSSLIEAQLKIQMLTNIREDYIIRPIDKPYIPSFKSGPSRTKFVFSFFVLGLLISLMAQIFNFYSKNKITDEE